ncbi:MAG TPA: hypothetical protein PKE45_02290 [Caldilineaceae bacterium]|nr:hypothetical protein [Caldilineaceae bacterium]
MHGTELEVMLARTQWQERERQTQLYLLEREANKARAARRLPHTGLIRRILQAIRWRGDKMTASWQASRELREA